MKTRTKIWLIVAASLVLIGGILFAGVMTVLKWDFMKLSTVSYEINTYEIPETFDCISVKTDTADIEFAYSKDGKCTVVCHEDVNAKHDVTVEDGVLHIALVDERSVLDYVGLNFTKTEITVYLPKTEYGSLSIEESAGDIRLQQEFTFEDIDILSSTGDVYCSASALGLLRIQTNTGDVTFDGCDAAEIFVETDTGDVTGRLLTEKIFYAQTDTGKVDVPDSITGGRCEISTNTGDIAVLVR